MKYIVATMKEEVIRARLTSEEKAKIIEIADSEGISVTDLIRKSILKEVAEEFNDEKIGKISKLELETYFLRLIIKSLIDDKNKLIGFIEKSKDKELQERILKIEDKTLNKKIKGLKDIDPSLLKMIYSENTK